MPITIMIAVGTVGFLAIMHLALILHDAIKKPRFFVPLDSALLSHMKSTRTALAPNGKSYWSGIVGFHLSHALGLFNFALLITVATFDHVTVLKPALVAVAAIYAFISYRCWFYGPTLSIGLVVILLAVGWMT